jgi:hypothetical protein
MKEAFEERKPGSMSLKRIYAMKFWGDATFGGIIQDWMMILDSAGIKVDPYARRISQTQVGSLDREQACNELEGLCKGVYEAILESGFKHLETMATKGCSSWDRVLVEDTI